MRRVVLGLVVLLVLVGGGAAALHFHLVRLPAFLGGRAAPPRPLPTVEVGVPQITTNLNGNSSNFAQITLTVGLAGPGAAKTFNARMPAIENALIADVRSLSLTQLNGAAGMQRLRKSVATLLDGILGSPSAVRAVYFTQFVVQ